MPPSARTESGVRPSSSRKLRHASTVAAGVHRQLADQMIVQQGGELGDRLIGARGARPSSSTASGSTVSLSGAGGEAGDVSCTIRPSVAAIAGWPAGIQHDGPRRRFARPRKVGQPRRLFRAPAEQRVSVSSAISEVLQGVDAERLGIDRFDDGARMLAAAVALPRVGEQRLFEHLALSRP